MAEFKGESDPIQGEIVHEYDGIQEADNQLPNWWLAIFYVTSVFGLLYWFYYHEYELAPSEMAAYAEAQAALAAQRPDVTVEQITAAAADASVVSAGAGVYASTCAVCHGDRGQGNIGPNLTDRYWIHGGDEVSIHTTIFTGVPTAGMPGWGASLGGDSVMQATAYVLSLRNTDVEGGKEPQGEPYGEPAPAEPAAAPPEAPPPTEDAPGEDAAGEDGATEGDPAAQ